jgi:hypothetical protein
MPWAAAAAAVVGIAGAASSADSARSAANSQSDAAKKGSGEMRREFDVSREDTAPWRTAGGAALGQLETGLGIKRSLSDQFANDPRYKAIYDEVYNRYDQAHRESQGNRPLSVAQTIDPDAYHSTMAKLKQEVDSTFAQKYPELAAATNETDSGFGALNKKFTMDDFRMIR